MFSKPTSSDLLEGVIISLQNDVLPELTSERAQVLVVIMQGVIQNVRHRIEVEQQQMAQEHNEMTALFRAMAVALGKTPGPEADRVRGRAATLGGRPPMVDVPAFAEINGAYALLSEGLVQTMPDLDALIRAGNTAAERALEMARAYLARRMTADLAVNLVGAGMVGRG